MYSQNTQASPGVCVSIRNYCPKRVEHRRALPGGGRGAAERPGSGDAPRAGESRPLRMGAAESTTSHVVRGARGTWPPSSPFPSRFSPLPLVPSSACVSGGLAAATPFPLTLTPAARPRPSSETTDRLTPRPPVPAPSISCDRSRHGDPSPPPPSFVATCARLFPCPMCVGRPGPPD